MRGGKGVAQVLLDDLVVAPVVEPDAVNPGRVLEVAHGGEGYPDGGVDVVLAFGHLGVEHADDGEKDAVEADGFADRVTAGKEFRFCVGTNDADVGTLLFFLPVEGTAIVHDHGEHVEALRAQSIDRPCVGVEVVFDYDVLKHNGCYL